VLSTPLLACFFVFFASIAAEPVTMGGRIEWDWAK